MKHTPVLSLEVMRILDPRDSERVLDVTVGLGGHARSFLGAIGPRGVFIGIDADAENLSYAAQCIAAPNVRFIHANFRDLAALHLEAFDVIFADLGLSSPHIDDPLRGFSFRAVGPLDLRFDRTRGRPAAALLREREERDLVRMFREYGELRSSHALARAIKSAAFPKEPTTAWLRSVVESVFRWRAPSVLPQVFQALRVAVNDEINALREFLPAAVQLLRRGGRLGVISYHSLEDREVKNFFRSLTQPKIDERTGQVVSAPAFRLCTSKAIKTSQSEAESNPRSRSARFRAIERSLVPGGHVEYNAQP